MEKMVLKIIKSLLTGEYKYERPLSELISLALDKKTLDTLVTRINKGKKISKIKPHSTSGLKYIEKILSEEVEKQFTEEYRPFIESILNGIDARPKDHEGKYIVKARITNNSFSVEDHGKSMGLKDILQTFIIPFSSDKDRLENIGRFGVGFFSNLIYCLEKPNEAEVILDTNDGENSYKLSFWSTSKTVDGLKVKVQIGTKRKQGTTLEIKGYPMDTGLRSYIEGYLKYFDPKRAQIEVGWSTVNSLPEGITYWGKETFQTEKGDVKQTVRFTCNPTISWYKDKKLRMYSQGIFILEKKLNAGEFRLDFPSAIDIVEGRDEFKIDENYFKAIDKAYDMIVEYAGKHAVKSKKTKLILRDMLPSIQEQIGSSFGYERVEKIKKILFPKKVYLLESDYLWHDIGEYADALRFFGKSILPKAYSPTDELASRFWKKHLPGLSSLIEDETAVLAEGNLDELRQYAKKNNIVFENTSALPVEYDYKLVKLKNSKGGFSPLIWTGGSGYINAEHEFLKPGHFAASYGLFTELLKVRGKEEEAIEEAILAR